MMSNPYWQEVREDQKDLFLTWSLFLLLMDIFLSLSYRNESASSILSDRSHVAVMKGAGLDLIPEWDIYDDEYDDTYDSHNVGADDHDSPDEMFTVKRYVVASVA